VKLPGSLGDDSEIENAVGQTATQQSHGRKSAINSKIVADILIRVIHVRVSPELQPHRCAPNRQLSGPFAMVRGQLTWKENPKDKGGAGE
jgi:hypothetical protein